MKRDGDAVSVARPGYDPGQAIYPVFAAQAVRAPDAHALLAGDRVLSYATLKTAAERVAARLRAAGVGRGDFVGLLESRSAEAIIAMLGVLRAGAAFVPLDPTHAPEQLAFIATDLPLKAALVAARYADRAPELLPAGLTALALEDVLAGPDPDSADWPEATGADPAYVMYTSGTTGTPKGVVTAQRGIAAIMLDQPLFAVTPDDVVLHASTIACDGSVFDIWGALLNGAACAIVETPMPAVQDVAAVMRRHNVTAAVFYAGLNHLMIDHALDAFASLRLVSSGGDVMSPGHAKRLLAAYPEIRLNNIYGPTETTMVSLGQWVTEELLDGGPLPIGRPMVHEEAFLVDEALRPLASGKTGQLTIAGPGVALGYYGRPEKTAEVFIDDPRPGKSGKVYLTGDLAHLRADGVFEFRGRVDRQVKLGGRRIELDGLEHVLRSQPGVADAAVELVKGPAGDKRIAGFLLPEGGMPADETGFVRQVMAAAGEEVSPATLPRVTRVTTDWPLTPAGKTDRKALLALLDRPTAAAPAQKPDPRNIRATIAAVWQEILACDPPDDDITFFEAGGTSLQLIDAHARLEARLGVKFDITLLFETPRLGDLAARLADLAPAAPAAEATPQAAKRDDLPEGAIAITGLAGRFPGADDLASFWARIRAGDNLIPRFAPEELEDVVPPELHADPAYVPARSVLKDVDLFDARFFNMLPRDAAEMDPQGRIFLEICQEALEDAGIDPTRAPGPVGVYAGATLSTYLLANIMADRAALDDFTAQFQIGNYGILTGNTNDNLAGRVAYKLNLHGPAMAISTACSTSLTAIAQAVQSLRAGACDVALAGGVSITFPQKRGYMAQEGGMGSTDGLCRPFDARAGGTVFGHGAGVVVLKRLEDALAAGDQIYAVIRGAGVNNDGAEKISYTAPSVTSQAAAIRMAHQDAGIDPATISYVECHGTATPLGDPIEIAGLTQAFGTGTPGACALGSVKGNIGHLDAAAGVVSTIKTALMLRAREILPVANFQTPNPRIDFASGPFRVPEGLEDWASDGPRRAGISSFGVGGTNVHLVLEEAPERPAEAPVEAPQILPLSATTPEALAEMAVRLADRLEASDAPALADAAFTLQEGRRTFPWRLAVAAMTNAEAGTALRKAQPPRAATPKEAPPVVFMFPGQGSQYPGMGKGLYASEPEYARWIDQGAEILKPLIDLDINELLCFGDVTDKAAARALRDTRITQPALYLTQVATARLWQARGIDPAAMLGHSVGEFAAATIAGVMSFETGLKIIAERGRLMQDQPPGAMLSVRCTLDELRPHLDDTVDLAALNAPKLQVVAGPDEAVDALAERLEAAGIAVTRLHTSHAFHSKMMDPVTPALEALVAGEALAAPQIPFVSSVTGRWITDDEAQSPAFWAAQARAPVNYQAALQAVCETRSPILLEVGAGRTLSAFAAQTLGRGGHGGIIQSLPDHTQSDSDDQSVMAAAFCQLWAAGAPVDWSRLPRGTRRVSLPPYPFQRKRHWIDPPPAGVPMAAPAVAATAMPPAPEIPAPQPAVPAASENAMTDVAQTAPRSARLTAELLALFSDLSGEDLAPEEATAPFLELGFDSLFMGQVAQALGRDYGVEMTFRSLLADTPSIAELAAHLDAVLPAEAAPTPAPAPAPAPQPAAAPAAQVPAAALTAAAPAMPAAPAQPMAQPMTQPMAAGSDLSGLLQAQMQTMQAVFAEQLRALGAAAPAPAAAQSAPAPVAQPAAAPATIATPVAPAAEEAPARKEGFKVGRGPSLAGAELTPDQRAFVADLAARYSERHAKSKAYTAEHRSHLADPRTAAGFHPDWKELTFPLVSDRSKGAYIWDVDGHRFVDVVNGFGQTAFGHSPDFVSAAVAAQLEKGYAIGPQSEKAGPLAKRLSEMLGHERVTFCNTGSEAVMAAMRVARAVTGREKIVVFSNDYHGQFDEVLIKGKTRGGDPAALPIAPGIPRSGLTNMVVLGYGAPESLDWISSNIKDIAAVIVEPVQSRHPELRPSEFCRDLRRITRDGGSALVFDEVVTGFRTHARGMQGIWEIEADMATYGKVIGGGLPVGLLAGARRFLDALDGGQWAYGDDSVPQVAPTFFAGTFVRHPLVLAAVEAVMDHLDARGEVLWTEVAARAGALAGRMNAALAERGLPELVTHFSSWFVINVTSHDPRAALLFPLMRMEGVHVQDGFCGFLTTAHSDEDIEAVYGAFVKAVDTLQSIGILTGTGGAARPSAAPQPAATATPTQAIPLTESQHEIWLTHQLGDGAACSFNEGVALRLDGPLDRAALEGALQLLIARHDALRLVFDRAGASFDVIAPYAPELALHDVSADPDPEAALEALLAKDAAEPFDLTAGPALRLALVALAPERHVLLMTAHHILCDGWSFNVLLDEMSQLYAAACEGRDAGLPPAPSFAAYAQAHAATEMRPETLAFWRAQYETIPSLPELPADHPRPAVKQFNGGTVTARIPVETLKAARKAGAKQGCTLFGTLFAALQITLGRLSGASDIVLGVPTGGQALLENQALVGHCVNFLPIRAAFDPAQPAAEHLARAGKAVMAAFDHQDTTYGALVRELEIPRALNRLPLTEVQFNLERVAEELPMGPVTGRAAPTPKAAANFDLFFNMIEGRDGLRVDVDYNADVYDPETVRRWIGHLEAVLAGLGADSATAIAHLPMMAPEALADLVEGRNRTAMDYDRAAMLPDLIARSAAATPEAVAVEAADAALTYAELAGASDALAAHIQAALPEPGARVAVALPRGAGMLVALIAVHKAGHTYVPLDPRQPAARLRTICETAEVSGLVCADAGFAEGLDIAVLHLADAPAGGTPAPVAADPERPAYVIFTSGSTGTPKGVAVPHRAVVNFLTTMAREPGMTAEDTLLSVTTVMFDIAVLELFLPLAVGGTVVIASSEDILDGFALAERVARDDITVMQATPTLWDMLLEAGLQPRTGLKMLAGGEPLPADLAQRLTAAGGELWNMYGPTETTIWSAVKRIAHDEPITIGGPIGNTDLHILSEAGEVQPIGVTGELNIGGDGLALGYYNRPDLTEAAFRDIALMGKPRRLYATGDLALRKADGGIVVLGRRDTQVKLRGFRIELGEIETRLRALPGIARAAVDVAARPSGDKLLAAWLVAEPGATLDTAAISASIAAQLPDYMVPQAWSVLDALPQTGNGKLDRKALPAPEAAAVLAEAPPADPPSGPTEEKIAAIWAEVLGRETIGATETLHALGVDSLSVFRIAARMLDAGLGLEARDMLAHPSIRDLAAFADARGGDTEPKGPARPSLKSFRGGARRGMEKAS
ncbi:amino acid adenylation domain-containing protein [Acidimangrovimonas pyrenivorans]|uniref:Amino acid adenylation domain-containing protein n=1 Tax=Acidimangrovimonas pyrenivorans TaxID=2030798 RepID=A0ABV7ACB4_9RHOB